MSDQLLMIIFSTFLISLSSFVGIATLAINQRWLRTISLLLVALSAGTFLGETFIHLLPQANQNLSTQSVYIGVLAAYTFFLIVESILHWHHCHLGNCDHHTIGYMNLLGDSVHNFIDGLIIAATFLIQPQLGLITVVAVALHEIPQELSDFGVLIYSGFKIKKALLLNFLVSLMVVVGGVVGWLLAGRVAILVNYLVPFAAGGFLYLATSDLIPQIKQEKNLKQAILNLGFFLLGIMIMLWLNWLPGD